MHYYREDLSDNQIQDSTQFQCTNRAMHYKSRISIYSLFRNDEYDEIQIKLLLSSTKHICFFNVDAFSKTSVRWSVRNDTDTNELKSETLCFFVLVFVCFCFRHGYKSCRTSNRGVFGSFFREETAVCFCYIGIQYV